MSVLKNIFVVFLLIGFIPSVYAAVSDFGMDSCAVFSESDNDKKDGDKKEGGEEEPDCE